jgi:hypothetical protein
MALAVTFGFMSLTHGPVMAFVKGNATSGHQTALAGDAHLHHQHDPDRSAPAMPEAVAVCYSFGCFVAVEPPAISAPGPGLSLLGRLSPVGAAVILPTWLDQPDPPPRLPT